nr:zinc finger CCCH domain-containing protein 4-like [Leptinotarsa decemlineata]XP_023017599.1 zinc finger CCCH domain-containing protein 4-like [Leptinotarsa decemlineata]XP_023017600.1 zinc finger CCCH domain-containing protein 4-like [Leptinotarsa decemlineata]
MAESENINDYSEDTPRRRPYHQNNQSMRPPYSARGRGRGIPDPHLMNTSDYLEDAPHKRPYQSNQSMRPPYSARGRGRGRPDPHVMKAMHFFGVRDLREILDRKHQEEAMRGGPTDSSWSDPELEDSYHQQHKDRQASQGGPPSRGSRGRGNARGRNKPTFIQNPLNVMVQFSTSTGERNYSVDENNTLDDIRHVPDHMYSLQPFGEKVKGRGGNWRGRPREAGVIGGEERGRGNERRGRGRGRGMSTRNREFEDGFEVRAKSAERSDRMPENDVKEHRARGRGKNVRSRSVETRDRVEVRDFERDPRGRGGSFRGRGHRRGRGKRHTNPSDENTQVQDTTGEQCVDSEENNPEESEVKIEQATEGETGILVSQKKKQEGNEKLVITSSGQENRKRVVRFDLKDDSEKQPENNVGNDTVECAEGKSEIDSETVAVTAKEDYEEENINESNCEKDEAIVDEKINS